MSFYFDIIKDFFKKYFGLIIILFLELIIISINICGLFYKKECVTNDVNSKISVNEIDQVDENTVGTGDAEEQKKTTFFIDVKGNVKKPGVYEVEEGAMVNDCIKKAGGLLKNADTSLINLSKKVKSEMVINVPSKNEVKAKTVNISDDITAKNDAEISKKPAENESTNQLININTADVLELQKLDGIGEAKAKAIIAYRDSIGGFKTIEEIKNVSGIGESAFAKIKDCITV